MRLILDVLGSALGKLVLFLGVILTLFVGYLLLSALVPDLREAVAERSRLHEVSEERAALEAKLSRLRKSSEEDLGAAVEALDRAVEVQLEEGREKVGEQTAALERLRDKEADACGFWQKVWAIPAPGNACEAAQRAVDKGDQVLDTFEKTLAQAEADAKVLGDDSLSPEAKLDRLGEGSSQSVIDREIENTESELGQKRAEEESLEEAQASGVGWVVNQWAKVWKWLVGAAVVIMLTPLLLPVVSYYLLMPLVHRLHKPIHLAEGSDDALTGLRATEAQRTLRIDLRAGEVLSARAGHVRPVQGEPRSRSQHLYDMRSPFISYAAGLRGLSRITGVESGTQVTLGSSVDPDAYLMRIDFWDHPGLVMHPKHVIGVMGKPKLDTRWRWGIQSFATWQVRYILFAGTGSLIVEGVCNVVADRPGNESMRMDQHLVMGFDSRLAVGVNRTEAFWPYKRGEKPLVNDEFTGQHPFFWQKSSSEGPSNPIAKVFNAIFSAFGKLLGF